MHARRRLDANSMHGWEVEPTPVANVESSSVALISVGQPRTVMHPAIAASFELFRSSILSRVHHFMWLTQTPAPKSILRRQSRGKVSPAERLALAWAQPLDPGSASWYRALKIYSPAVFILSNDSLPCRTQCGVRCNTIRHDTPIEFFRQFFAISNAWRAVLRYEQERMAGRPHTWYVRLRPDLLHLQPLVPLAALSREHVHVPSGIMTSAQRYQKLNDHIVLCATQRLCEVFFRLIDRHYIRCGRDFRMPWPPQLLFAREYATMPGGRGQDADVLRLFRHAYTVTRPETGPECERLKCHPPNPFATGCVAKHLPAAAPLCEELAHKWRADSNDSAAVPTAASPSQVPPEESTNPDLVT